MKYIFDKKVINDYVKNLWKRGGQFQKAAEKIQVLIGKLAMGEPDVLSYLKQTNHGETRLNNCIKYDLNGFCRLVTIQENGLCAIMFLGTHEECDRWLDNNKGRILVADEGQGIVSLNISEDVNNVDDIRPIGNRITEEGLLEKLKGSFSEIISDMVSGSIYKVMMEFDSFTDENEILEICMKIPDPVKHDLLLDVLLCLKEDDVDGAKNRILFYQDQLKKIAELKKEEIESLVSNEEFITLEDFRGIDLENLINSSSWFDWMLFMHPQQRKVVEMDFNGPSRLLGVSGSGKTCVVVNRAIRLSKKYPEEKILITTINQALSKLIKNLISIALQGESERDEIENRIEVFSFWELSRQLLLENENDPIKRRSYDLFSDKHLEDVDEVWKEFYFMENNNTDVKVLKPVNQSLLNRHVLPIEYIKQEFDWIRSAIFPNERESYLNIDRSGRAEALTIEYRKLILEALGFWENKMNFVGVCDYLGLIGPLSNYLDKITPRYRCILVDELQDFGTTELTILRKLVQNDENDLFLCGDIAQQVHTKHQMISKAGVQILPHNYLKIVKNYRNSRQILEAAYDVFTKNVSPESYNSKEFELLNPEYANFSSPKPFLRKAENLDQEFNFAYNYLLKELDKNEKGCIAFCGLTYFQVKSIADNHKLPVLDGYYSITEDKIFISDLDQTKGFEFDKMIIVNCSNDIFPNNHLPENEQFRDISKLYVSMTRAKKELIISYSNTFSKVFSESLMYFNEDTTWKDYLELDNMDLNVSIIDHTTKNEDEILKLSGLEYIFTPFEIGLSGTAQEKLLNTVTGKKVTEGNVITEFPNIKQFKSFLFNPRFTPQMTRVLGSSTIIELKEHFEKLN